jgi:hypothetical protein
VGTLTLLPSAFNVGTAAFGRATAMLLSNPKVSNYLNRTFNVLIQFIQLRCGNPIFTMARIADNMNIEPTQEVRSNVEFQNVALEARSFIFRVPVSGDLNGILFVQDRIKERLGRQARRETSKFSTSNQFQLFSADRAI